MPFHNTILSNKLVILCALLSATGLWYFGYEIQRSNFPLFIGLFAMLFALFYVTVANGKSHFLVLTVMAILLRLIFLPSIPNLSQDFYRFIWDGRMLASGINPYLSTPLSYIESGNLSIISQAEELYKGMGLLNASHYTNYPPINQFMFYLAGILSSKSILGATIVLRAIIILAEVGIIIYGKKLLEKVGLPTYHIFWYALNPFVIIEMTGNLHFEPVMLFFVILSFYLLVINKWIWSAVFFAFSIATKLLPLLLLPLFLNYFLTKGGKITTHFRSSYPLKVRFRESVKNLPKLIYFYLIILGLTLLTFLPFIKADFVANFGASIALWFKKFEFNASLYYIIRYIGFQKMGYNIIGTAGPFLSKVVVVCILMIAILRNNRKMLDMITGMLIATFIYFLLSTTVHPWYVATPLLLCVFTKYRFPLVWSFTVMLSYAAYGVSGFQENLWLVAIEYAIVIGFFIWEVFLKEKMPVEVLKSST
ncbi:mannosyltransferase [Dokdonia sp. Hel_I_53]|uniref:mannosyltransferase n=1 Tax=Dokdonia sp. Hel_I_53 TaxID=1566287 RepID=UPI00119A543B|nr:mannosyltransferase [Dokdonia sp. Hel_I_53]TVZ52295.1 hypothetical protein OD90_1467 [Dokdonia sp. Hel_I_53]